MTSPSGNAPFGPVDRTSEELLTLRRAAFAAAYRMLGTHADAEDAAQEALIRLHQTDPPPSSARAWITAVSTHLCIDRLRSAQVRREAYVGPWLPEPALSEVDPAEEIDRAESISLALLVVLETLSPTQRAAFLLHDVFGYDYPEVALTVQRTETACRQLVSRARRALQHGRVRYEPDPQRRSEVALAFLTACSEGDVQDLVSVLADDVVMRSDGGGVAQASRIPLQGADRCARALVALRTNAVHAPSVLLVNVNGTPGIVIFEDGIARSLMGVDVADGRVMAIHVVREPGKLAAALSSLPARYPDPVTMGPPTADGGYVAPDELTDQMSSQPNAAVPPSLSPDPEQ
jgi:RNA polymerase sigma-70 factor (ECF subfamily)